jgi:hypothetical protein
MRRLLLPALLVATPAFAHKAKDADHTHCTLDGKGVEVAGKTDAERKTACGSVKGAVWDESKPVVIEIKLPAKKPGD